MRIPRCLFRLTVVVAVSAVLGAAVAAAPAQAVPAGDFTVTMAAADIGADPATLRQVVNDVNTEDARDDISLDQSARRWVEEFGGDASGWVHIDITASVTADGSRLTFTVPAAEVQTTAGWWATLLSTVLGIAAGYGMRALCIAGLTATGVGAALVPLVCTPFGGAMTALVQSLIQHGIDGDIGSKDFWTDTLIKMAFGAVGGFAWEKWLSPWAKSGGATAAGRIGNWLKDRVPGIASWFGTGAGTIVEEAGDIWIGIEVELPLRVADFDTHRPPTGPLPCDVYDGDGANCVGTYSTARALYSSYGGPLYQVQRGSDKAKSDIGLLAVDGYVNAAGQDSFCAHTSCTISKIYDQSAQWNDLTLAPDGGAAGGNHLADATALPITVNGHKAYGVYFDGRTGYRNNNATATAQHGAPEGMYMVASGTHVNDGCCFDFGNAERNSQDTGNGHMDAVNLGTKCYFPPCTGSGPWVEADLENGLFSGGNGSNLANQGNGSDFVTALLKNNGQTTYALKGGDARGGGLSTWWNGVLPTIGGYKPMQQEGAIILGIGGDNSNWSIGSFFEGAITYGYPSDAADDKVQSSVVAAAYAGNSGGHAASAAPTAAGQAVIHDGYSSVFTVNSANSHLEETYLPRMGAAWATQDLSAKYGTPPVLAGTKPVTLTHDGYTSVFTVDAGSGHLQETYLPKMGDPWSTQDLSAKYGAPATSWTPTAVVHDGYTSVWSVNAVNGHLQETYLPKMGDPWSTQDLSAKYGTAPTSDSPIPLLHPDESGAVTWSSVYTVDQTTLHLRETYLPAIGKPWTTQDLSAKYGTPQVAATAFPAASWSVNHDGYTSAYTVRSSDGHLFESYLPAMGQPWATQDLSANYGSPRVDGNTMPVSLTHDGYTSVYTIEAGTGHLWETYLTAMGQPWHAQDLSRQFGTPASSGTPTAVYHSGYTSVYTASAIDGHLWETYLPALGGGWFSQDLTQKYHTPAVFPGASPVAVLHSGWTSVYTINVKDLHLSETYLPAIGQPWTTQDLSAKYHTPASITTPAVLVHDGFTSVYTLNLDGGGLSETYLPAMGDDWITQDLSAKYHTPPGYQGIAPVAVYHAGYASVYTVDRDGQDLQETYLPAISDDWSTQVLSQKYQAPAVGRDPSVLVHADTSGGLTWTSVFSVRLGDGHVQETYLPRMGDPWSTQDLNRYGTPPA